MLSANINPRSLSNGIKNPFQHPRHHSHPCCQVRLHINPHVRVYSTAIFQPHIQERFCNLGYYTRKYRCIYQVIFGGFKVASLFPGECETDDTVS